jgi:hypothetical protein
LRRAPALPHIGINFTPSPQASRDHGYDHIQRDAEGDPRHGSVQVNANHLALPS